MVRKSGDSKRRKPLVTFSKAGFSQAGKKTIKDKSGYLWTHVSTVDEPEAKRLKLFYTRAKKDFKIVKNGSAYEVFMRKE
jgi:hypothetical protein